MYGKIISDRELFLAILVSPAYISDLDHFDSEIGSQSK